jgi:DNA mismatch repair protein MutS
MDKIINDNNRITKHPSKMNHKQHTMNEYLLYYEEYSIKYGKNNIVILMQVGSFFEIYAYKDNLEYLDTVANVLGIRRTRKRSGKANGQHNNFDDSSDDDSDNSSSDDESDEEIESVVIEKPKGRGKGNNKKKAKVAEPVKKKKSRTIYMSGFMCHKIDNFLPKLLDYNYTVIEIRQVQNKQKLKLDNVERQVTKVYTPGTYLVNPVSKESNYLMYLYIEETFVRAQSNIIVCCGISVVDFSTGEIIVYEILSPQHDEKYALDEALRFLNSFVPKEIILCHISPKIIDSKYYDDFELAGKIIKNKSLTKDSLITYFELEGRNYKYYTTINENFNQHKYANAYLSKIYGNIKGNIISSFHLEVRPYALTSLLGLTEYVSQRDKQILDKLQSPIIFKSKKHLLLGNNAVSQLNVIGGPGSNANGCSLNNGGCLDIKKISSLFDVINHTRTPMGQRYLYNLIINPVINTEDLQNAYNRIEECRENKFYLKLEEILKTIIDFERYWRKLTLLKIDPYEFLNFYKGICAVPKLVTTIKEHNMPNIIKLIPEQSILDKMELFTREFKADFDLKAMKHTSLISLEKSIFTKEFCNKINCPRIIELQTLIDLETGLMDEVCKVLAKYLVTDGKKKGGFGNSITMKYINKVGHYLYMTTTKSKILKENIENLDTIKINDSFSINPKKLRFQDTPNGKNTKVFFDELGVKSANVDQLKAELIDLVHTALADTYAKYVETYDATLRQIFKFITYIDTLQSAAKVSVIYNYCKPIVKDNDSGYIRAKQLRHPIIERIRTDVEYIPHDIEIGINSQDNNKLNGILIYGLNSSGKSSLMKAIGLSVVMAQCGMYVPAENFEFSPYDSLFARITGNDNIFKGQSSFTLEMTELDTILERTGPKTLVIGDEVCRGTEHVSGSAIVAATIIKLSKTQSSFIFASHLHDIATMDEIKELTNVKAFHLTVEYDANKDTLIYDRKLKEGSGDTVYGFTVAKYIIKNTEFMDLVVLLKNKITNSQGVSLSDKKSKYNNNIYMDHCIICGKGNEGAMKHNSNLDTHHINFQKDCKDGFVASKPHLPMNNEANLSVLCKECHHKVTYGKLEIYGYVDTINGPVISYKFLDGSDNNIVTEQKNKVLEIQHSIINEEATKVNKQNSLISAKTRKPSIKVTAKPRVPLADRVLRRNSKSKKSKKNINNKSVTVVN